MPRTILFFVCLSISANLQSQSPSLPTKSDDIEVVTTDKSGITVTTRIVVEKENEKTKIIFWQETENGFIFKDVNWKGDVELLLDNGETLTLNDSKMKGHLMERGGYMSGIFVPDIYIRYAAYYLTDLQCELLKKHSLMLVSYYVDDKYDKKIQYLELSDKTQSLKAQLTAIGK